MKTIPGISLLTVAMSLLAQPALAQDKKGERVIRPKAAPGPLDNPLKGWCPYTDAGPIRQPYSLVFLYVPWKDLEPEEGHYAFERWEKKAWSVPQAKGKHIVFRVYIDYPSLPSGLPEWLKAKGVKQTPYTDHGGGLSPDYNDPRLISSLERLITAMGQRYDGHPRIAFVQLGLLGFWGEWHTWPRETLYASADTERRILEAFHGAFRRTIVLARTARGPAGRYDWLGFHDDLFPEDTDNGEPWSFLATLRAAGRSANWQRAAIGGEMVPNAASVWLGPKYDQTTSMVSQAHVSWVGPYCPAIANDRSPEFRQRSESLVRQMGYQFRLKEIRHTATVEQGGSLSLAIQGENEGIAPFYYPWPIELALLDSTGKPVERHTLPVDIRTWKPGPFQFQGRLNIKATAGHYRLALGIIDPGTKQPAVAFANSLERLQGWTILSKLEVVTPP